MQRDAAAIVSGSARSNGIILNADDLNVSTSLPTVTLQPMTLESRPAVLRFVEAEFTKFVRHYESPEAGATVFSVVNDRDEMVGTIISETNPKAAETTNDAALACVVLAKDLHGQGYGSAAIAECCITIFNHSFRRVIAEWVASIGLYKRLGLIVWRTKQIDDAI